MSAADHERVGENERPSRFFDDGLQQERTALAWERTCLSLMAAGALVARFAAKTVHPTVGVAGIAVVATGGVLLLRSATRYEWLHARLRAKQSPVQLGAIVACSLAALGASLVAVAAVVVDRLV
jgi:uncharacterized membrane protein YidH (DUF202 family)